MKSRSRSPVEFRRRSTSSRAKTGIMGYTLSKKTLSWGRMSESRVRVSRGQISSGGANPTEVADGWGGRPKPERKLKLDALENVEGGGFPCHARRRGRTSLLSSEND